MPQVHAISLYVYILHFIHSMRILHSSIYKSSNREASKPAGSKRTWQLPGSQAPALCTQTSSSPKSIGVQQPGHLFSLIINALFTSNCSHSCLQDRIWLDVNTGCVNMLNTSAADVLNSVLISTPWKQCCVQTTKGALDAPDSGKLNINFCFLVCLWCWLRLWNY